MPSSLASRISSPLAVSTPNSASASACTAAATDEGGCGNESQDVLSPLPTSSSLSRAASAAIARSGGSALANKKGKGGKMKHAGGRGSGGNYSNGHNHGRGRKTSQMKVVARIRPLSAEEMERGCTETVVPIVDDCQGGNANEDTGMDNMGADENAPPSSSSSSVYHTPKIGNRRTAISEGIAADNDNSPMARQRQPASTSLLAGGNANATNASAASAAVPKQFDYDAVFSSTTTQRDVYDLSVGDAIKRNVFRGYNTTIIAYGQTSSGKTYTMNGPAPPTEAEQTIAEDEAMTSPTARPFVSPRARGGMSPKRRGQSPKRGPTGAGPRRRSSLARLAAASAGSSAAAAATGLTLTESDGIIPRAIHDLFEAQRTEQRDARIHLSYLEIYNDSIRDLLGGDEEGDGTAENLPLLDDGHGVSVRGLSSTEVRTAGEAKELMDLASLRRTTGATGSNAWSSRSHAICILTVSINHGKRKRSKAKLTLVDLAGSERLKQTGAEGLTQQEGISINRDLFVLGKVVAALADKSKQGRRSSVTHIPYRDCKLTRILRDSLGGNCCTVMVACISPASVNLEESVNTLRYAQRAKSITNAVKQNVVARSLSSTESLAMQKENKLLKTQIADLMKALNEMKMNMMSKPEQAEIEEGEKDEAKTTEAEPTNTGGEDTDAEAKSETATEEAAGEAAEPAQQNNDDIFLDTFNQDDGVDDDLLSVDIDEASSFCDYSIASSITMLDDSIADDSFDVDITEKRELVERLEGESAKLQEQVDSLSKEVTETNGQLQEAKDKKLDLEANVNEMTATQNRIQYEMDSMKHQIKVLTNERKEILEEIEEIQELGAVITLLNEEQDTRRQAEAEVERLNKEASANASECKDLRKKFAKMEADMESLKKALEVMSKENANLKKELELRDQEASATLAFPPMSNVLAERSTNVENNVSISGADAKEKSGADAGSVSSEHRKIRIHAAKMLWFANKSVENKQHKFGDMSAVSSIASNQSMDSANYLDSADNSIASIESSNTKSSKKSISKKLKKKLGLSKGKKKNKSNKLPPSGMPKPDGILPRDSQQTSKTTIDGLIAGAAIAQAVGEEMEVGNEICTCTTPIFGENAKEMEFYLPKIGDSACTCGKGMPEDLSIKGGDYFALENILRPWQVAFLATVGIKSAKELINLSEARKSSVCSAMKQYRKKIAAGSGKPVKTQHCAVALHIWIKTCKTALKNEYNGSGPNLPNFLDISFCNSRGDESSVSTIGNGSVNSLNLSVASRNSNLLPPMIIN